MSADAVPDDLYTQKQKDYVASLPDDPAVLKDHLLHQIRLRDNLGRDRDKFELENNRLSEVIRDARQIIKQFRDAHPDTRVEATDGSKFAKLLSGEAKA